ncbi:MAG TPA: hypothetical protein VMU22_09145 [Rhizomicrobium sp.]|nr:hypothetical protein [Rhizomicrobium sp.]
MGGALPFSIVPVLYFHIPKTGGTSVASAVRTSLRRGGALGIYDVRVTDSPQPAVERRLQRLSRSTSVRFVHGHLSPVSVPQHIALHRAVTLREPIDRLLSHFCYCFQHRHADSEQFAFFTQAAYVGRTNFFAEDVAVWARTFQADNYVTRFLSGRIEGPLVQRDADEAERQLRGMAFIGFTNSLQNFVVELAGALGVEAPSAQRANSSDRSVVTVSAGDARALADAFLRLDQVVFEAAKNIAASRAFEHARALPASPEGRSVAERLSELAFTVRHRTIREWRTALAARVAPVRRRLKERAVIASMPHPQDLISREGIATERVDLAAE